MRQSDTASSLIQRWQAMIHIFLSVQLHNIVPFGYSANEPVLHFARAFHARVSTISIRRLKRSLASQKERYNASNFPMVRSRLQELRDLSLQRWRLMIERAFGVTLTWVHELMELTQSREATTISVEQARLIALKLSFRMLSEPFLKTVDSTMVREHFNSVIDCNHRFVLYILSLISRLVFLPSKMANDLRHNWVRTRPRLPSSRLCWTASCPCSSRPSASLG